MHDQAEKLRLKMLQAQGELARSVAIVSGKGGVGKSNFSTNFACALSLKGKKVIIIDMDIGMGNIHILLGMTPRFSLRDYLLGACSLEEVVEEVHDGFTFISGGSGLDAVMEWSEPVFEKLISTFETLQKKYDVILFDMGAGATQRSIELLLSVDEIIVISTTEPTSITDAYSMMKFICLQNSEPAFHLVSNRVGKDEDGMETASRLRFAAKKFLLTDTDILGFLPEDPVVHQSVVAQKPFIQLFPKAPVSKKMEIIAEKFLNPQQQIESREKSGFLQKLRNMFTKGDG